MKTTKYALAAALGLIALAVPRVVRADQVYQFNINASQDFSAFTFSFTAPTFVVADDTPAFTPFSITSTGGITWTFNQALATNGALGGNACFRFGTTAANFGADCGPVVTFPGPDAGLVLPLSVPLPTTDGTFQLSGASILFAWPTGVLDTPLTGDLVVSSVPEPSTPNLLLIGIGLLGLVGATRKLRFS